MYSEPAYVARLLEAGVTRFYVSVHGHGSNGRLYGEITQGGSEAHALMLRGIANLIAAGVAPIIDMIMMRSTYATLLDGVRDLHGRGVRAFRLWLVSLTDGNRENVESLPRISEMVPAMKECLEYARAHALDVTSLHVPRCFLPGYEEHVFHPGFGEDVTVVTPDAVFQLSRSRLGGQKKTARCEGCVWFDRCPGVRDDYLERWGDGELSAVTTPPSP
jgi:cyclic pyranopterin phosphate synthase